MSFVSGALPFLDALPDLSKLGDDVGRSFAGLLPMHLLLLERGRSPLAVSEPLKLVRHSVGHFECLVGLGARCGGSPMGAPGWRSPPETSAAG